MNNYSNYNNIFRANIELPKINNNAQAQGQTEITNDEKTSQLSSMSSVTPDFNVKIPIGYTKIGVEKLSNGQEVHCYKLNNGQRVYIAPKESAMTTLNTYVNTGAMNETSEERGISHFCEHMAFNGTKGTDGYMKLGVGDIMRKVGDMGGDANASTSFGETIYTISIPQFNKSDFETVVEMQSSMLNNLAMTDEMVDKEHGPVTSEINMYSDIPDSYASNLAIKNLYQIQTPSNDIIAGTVDNIMNIDSKKVTEYYKNNYFPANMSTVITGDVNPDEAIEIVSKHFRGSNPNVQNRVFTPFKPIDKTIRKDVVSPKAVATSGILCFDGPKNNDPKSQIVAVAINHFLFNKKHSKLESDLEDYGVNVTASVDNLTNNPTDGKILSLTYDTTEENSEIVLKSIFSNLANFKAPTDEEMDTLKTALKMKYEKGFEDMTNLNVMLGKSSLSGSIDSCTKAIDIIDNLTPQDMTDAVHKYYDTNKVSMVVIHPDKTDVETINNNYNKAKTISFKGLHSAENAPKQPLKTDTIDTYTLDNNINVAIADSSSDIASYSISVRPVAPANVKPAVLEVLSTLLRKISNKTLDQADKNNMSMAGGVNGKALYQEVEVPVKNLATALEITKDILFNPTMQEEDFRRSKQEVKNNFSTVQPNAYENLSSTLFPDSPRGYSQKDILNNIDNVSLEEVKGLYQYLVDNGGITFAISMPSSKYPDAKSVLNRELSTIKKSKPVDSRHFNDFKPVEKSVVVSEVANTSQAEVVQAYKFYNSHDPKDLATYELMNSILSNGDETGLYNNLREKQKLAYSVYSSCNVSNFSSSIISCAIKTTTDSADLKSYDNVQKSINGFQTQINKMMNGEFTDKELETAKLNYKRHLLESTDLSSDKSFSLSQGMTSKNGFDEINQIYNAVDSITKEDVQKASQYVFSQKPVYSIRASQDTLNANKEFLQSLEK